VVTGRGVSYPTHKGRKKPQLQALTNKSTKRFSENPIGPNRGKGKRRRLERGEDQNGGQYWRYRRGEGGGIDNYSTTLRRKLEISEEGQKKQVVLGESFIPIDRWGS